MKQTRDGQNRDFFDGDLRESTRTHELALDADVNSGGDTLDSRALSRLVAQKQDRTAQLAGAAQEMEALRARQRELEREREALESLARRQDDYEERKRDVRRKLERSLIMLEKQATEAARAADMAGTVRERFAEVLREVQDLNETAWAPDAFETELSRAAAVVEQAEQQLGKGLSRVHAMNWFKGDPTDAPAVLAPAAGEQERGFGFWLKAGVAFTLPLVVLVLLVMTVWLLIAGGYWPFHGAGR